MLDESYNNSIVRFVRNTLGCRCPEEVFESIEVESGSMPDGAIAFTRMVIGKRLLIYILTPLAASGLETLVPVLMEMGIRERDEKGYNRFRLAVATPIQTDVPCFFMEEFKQSAALDERAHIHFIPSSELPISSG